MTILIVIIIIRSLYGGGIMVQIEQERASQNEEISQIVTPTAFCNIPCHKNNNNNDDDNNKNKNNEIIRIKIMIIYES